MAEARDRDVKGSQPAERRGRPGAVCVEHAAHDPPIGAACRGVPGEQDPVPGQVERKAPRRMAGNGDRHGAIAEPGLVTVRELAINPGRHHRLGREPPGDLVVDGPFPVGQVRGGPGHQAADERRVGVVREHLDSAPAGDTGCAADVVGMEVREYQPPQLRRFPSRPADRVGDQRRGAGKAGVDQRQAIGIGPQAGMPDREPDEVQPRRQLDDVHVQR